MVNNLILSPSMNYSIYQSSIESATTTTSKVQICTLKGRLKIKQRSEPQRSIAHLRSTHFKQYAPHEVHTLTSPEAGTTYEVRPATSEAGNISE
jgi:hypothetical protein